MLLERYTDTTDLIYSAATGQSDWNAALRATSDLCGMANCAMILVEPSIGATQVTAPHADPDLALAYAAHWWDKDPTVPVTSKAPVGKFTSIKNTGRDVFEASEFHNDYWRNSELSVDRIHTNVMVDGEARATLVLHNSAITDEITEECFRLFTSLQPHFVQAVGIQRRLMRLELAHATADTALMRGAAHVFAVDQTCKWVPSDDAIPPELGELALCSGLVSLNHGRVSVSDPRAGNQLRKLVNGCTHYGTQIRGGSVMVPDANGRPSLRIDVEPWGFGLNGLPTLDPRAPVALLVLHDLTKRYDA